MSGYLIPRKKKIYRNTKRMRMKRSGRFLKKSGKISAAKLERQVKGGGRAQFIPIRYAEKGDGEF